MTNIEDKMQEFIPGITSLDEPGPELLYLVDEAGKVQQLITYPDGTETRGPDASGTLSALLGGVPGAGWYTASGSPYRKPTPPRATPG